jgi:hypothetical protein
MVEKRALKAVQGQACAAWKYAIPKGAAYQGEQYARLRCHHELHVLTLHIAERIRGNRAGFFATGGERQVVVLATVCF